jgi:NADPH-dependent curcumin reductase CurA
MLALRNGQARVKNFYVSMDAGFRNWMDEDSGDEVLPAMALGAPVMGLVLGEVIESKNKDIPLGNTVMTRLAWEQYSTVDGDDWLVTLSEEEQKNHPLSYHLGVLGDTGMSAYFGMTDIAKPRAGETVLISAAGGAVGSVAGQIAKIMGARAVGFAGNKKKCHRLVEELGYDDAINYKSSDIHAELERACPNGVDVYFDNVGGQLLEYVLEHINQGARIPFCGAVADYAAQGESCGPRNLFRLVAQSATLKGFMTHLQTERYPEARAQLSQWLSSGQLQAREQMYEGVEQCGVAFSDLFAGKNFGKTVVKVV